MKPLKQIIHLLNALADNIAAEQRCVLQLAKAVERYTDQTDKEALSPELGDDGFSLVESLKKLVTPKPEWPVGKTIMTEEDAKKYGHPVWSTLEARNCYGEIWTEPCCAHIPSNVACPKNNASELKVAPEPNEMDIRPVQLGIDGKDTYFVPNTHKDSKGRQLGVFCDNRYGISIVDNTISAYHHSYPSEEIESITKEIHKR